MKLPAWFLPTRSRPQRIGILLLLVNVSTLSGQADSARGLQTVRNLPATTLYKVHTRNQSIMFGRVLRATPDSLVLSAGTIPGREAPIALRDITEVWFRHGTNGGKGFLLGTGIGVGLGLMVGAGGDGGDLGSGSGRTILATLLGCVGAVTGTLIGMNTDHYSRVSWP